jgi:hypothetical protein
MPARETGGVHDVAHDGMFEWVPLARRQAATTPRNAVVHAERPSISEGGRDERE